jgi:hypothetical protein
MAPVQRLFRDEKLNASQPASQSLTTFDCRIHWQPDQLGERRDDRRMTSQDYGPFKKRGAIGKGYVNFLRFIPAIYLQSNEQANSSAPPRSRLGIPKS